MSGMVELGHRPALTGLRGVAASLVVFHHVLPGTQLDGLGWLGVAMFYTLSGFLITKLMLEERDRAGRVNVIAFYKRRARRLLPALWFAVACVLGFGALTGWWAEVWIGCVGALGYVGNFLWIGGHDLGPVGVTYTLAVEEHFYLAWPWLFPLVAQCRRPLRLFAGIIATVMVVRVVLLVGGVRPEFTTATAEMCADRLLVGVGLAFLVHRRTLRRVGWLAPTAVLCGLSMVGSVTFLIAGLFVGAVATAALIASLLTDDTSPVSRFLSSRPLQAVGRVSYGLYLWHYITWWFMQATGPATVARSLASLAVAIAMTLVSWCLIERPSQSTSRAIERSNSSVFAHVNGTVSATFAFVTPAALTRRTEPPASTRQTPL